MSDTLFSSTFMDWATSFTASLLLRAPAFKGKSTSTSVRPRSFESFFSTICNLAFEHPARRGD